MLEVWCECDIKKTQSSYCVKGGAGHSVRPQPHYACIRLQCFLTVLVPLSNCIVSTLRPIAHCSPTSHWSFWEILVTRRFQLLHWQTHCPQQSHRTLLLATAMPSEWDFWSVSIRQAVANQLTQIIDDRSMITHRSVVNLGFGVNVTSWSQGGRKILVVSQSQAKAGHSVAEA